MTEFLREDNGNLSSIRLALVIWVMFFSASIVISTTFNGIPPPIPWEYIGITTILVGGKVASKPLEQKPGEK